MLECMILGDSIAVGIGHYRPECITEAEVGITSKNYILEYGNGLRQAQTVIISLGSNDHKDIDTEEGVLKLRRSIDADKVIWILPSAKIKPHQRAIILKIAEHNGDLVITIPLGSLSDDGIHPTGVGYRSLAERTKD